jgi:hypothetical protein
MTVVNTSPPIWVGGVEFASRFPSKTRLRRAIRRQFARQELERGAAPEPQILGKVDVTHPTVTGSLENPVMGQRLADHGLAPCPEPRSRNNHFGHRGVETCRPYGPGARQVNARAADARLDLPLHKGNDRPQRRERWV